MVGPIKSTGKCVTMDSGFAVLMGVGVVEMERLMGVFGQSLVKKRGRYWPKGVPGDELTITWQTRRLGTVQHWRFHLTGTRVMSIVLKVRHLYFFD